MADCPKSGCAAGACRAAANDTTTREWRVRPDVFCRDVCDHTYLATVSGHTRLS